MYATWLEPEGPEGDWVNLVLQPSPKHQVAQTFGLLYPPSITGQ